MDAPQPSGTTKRRVTLTIARPRWTWGARPTVVVDGVGHPAQWGTGTWAVADDGSTDLGVYLYNRAWRWGAAHATVSSGAPATLTYRAPVLPLGAGSVTVPAAGGPSAAHR
ncbi:MULTISPECIES: hypothetical protein [unclassified Curtobacterium]|uniref:hypothetical protein n=1 Tax=unclassified Curtobacterium TaxID=257496 RepID=UPI000825D662|nr:MULTISPECIES: hypothetical protein [unclassified Curtobacterium]WIA97534.1 hypothetical protein QOL16_03830 [Curtobacterium sp. MCBA15_004]